MLYLKVLQCIVFLLTQCAKTDLQQCTNPKFVWGNTPAKGGGKGAGKGRGGRGEEGKLVPHFSNQSYAPDSAHFTAVDFVHVTDIGQTCEAALFLNLGILNLCTQWCKKI